MIECMNKERHSFGLQQPNLDSSLPIAPFSQIELESLRDILERGKEGLWEKNIEKLYVQIEGTLILKGGFEGNVNCSTKYQ